MKINFSRHMLNNTDFSRDLTLPALLSEL